MQKTVVITGGGRGIGLGLAQDLAARGASLVINDNGVELNGEPGDPSVAENAARAIRETGGQAVASADSIAEPETAAKLVDLAVSEFGRLDAWANAQTITRDRMLFNMSDEEWSEVVAVDLGGTWRTRILRSCPSSANRASNWVPRFRSTPNEVSISIALLAVGNGPESK